MPQEVKGSKCVSCCKKKQQPKEKERKPWAPPPLSEAEEAERLAKLEKDLGLS